MYLKIRIPKIHTHTHTLINIHTRTHTHSQRRVFESYTFEPDYRALVPILLNALLVSLGIGDSAQRRLFSIGPEVTPGGEK